jgi:Uma2 family endonuclease
VADALVYNHPRDEDAGVRKHEWTAEEVYRAMAAGVFGGRPVDWLKMELIEGDLIEKMPQNRPHSAALSIAASALAPLFGARHYIAQQVPLHVDHKSEPEPDIMVVAGSPRDYRSHPTGRDTRLVLEISDTTLRQDRHTKSRLYARAGVDDYWILILKTRLLEVRRNPAPAPENDERWEYQTIQVFGEHDSVAPLHAPDGLLLVRDLLPDPA